MVLSLDLTVVPMLEGLFSYGNLLIHYEINQFPRNEHKNSATERP